MGEYGNDSPLPAAGFELQKTLPALLIAGHFI